MEQLTKSDLEIIDSFSKEEKLLWEDLTKKCPRCGGASANKSNPVGRCSSCLKKLRANKKKPGHYLHLHKLADDSIRRQNGDTPTSKKKSSGRGSRKAIMSKMKAAEKKAGQVLSPDRKDNSKGYASSNVRAVPPKLNRGRHHVDPKKLASWRKRLKKTGLSEEELFTLILAKAIESGFAAEFVEALSKAVSADE